jgi:DHA1 family bicyclomycin/chloramphenicol resistance-like MFS transporter
MTPSVGALVALRFLQGVAGAAGIVIARAVVRDVYDGVEAARFYSLLMVAIALAPVLAPLIGAQVIQAAGWREVFTTLAIITALILVAALLRLPETWPPDKRRGEGVVGSLKAMATVSRERELMGYALASGLAFAGLFAYIAASPFVIQNVYGASPQAFSLIFALNACGLAASGQLNGWLVGRLSPRRLLIAGLAISCLAGVALLGVIVLGVPGLPAFLVPLFVLVSSMSIITPNALALAMAGHRETAGSASAFLGVLQFVIGAAVAPLVGIAGPDTAVPMGIIIALLGAASLVAVLTLTANPANQALGRD